MASTAKNRRFDASRLGNAEFLSEEYTLLSNVGEETQEELNPFKSRERTLHFSCYVFTALNTFSGNEKMHNKALDKGETKTCFSLVRVLNFQEVLIPNEK